MSLYDRCLTRGLPGAMIPGFYNHNYLILQTPDYVVLQIEMIHDTRIIPLDGRPHLQPNVQQWLGDSRAHWEDNTLVVETTNFTDKAEQRTVMGPFFLTMSTGEHLRLVERFTRIDTDTMDLPVHGRRSDGVYETLDCRDPNEEDRGLAVRVRLSRGKLRPAEHPRRRARQRASRVEHRLELAVCRCARRA